MATSFEGKLNELEARLKARNGISSVEHIPGDVSTSSPAPRRPKPCKFGNINSHLQSAEIFAGCLLDWKTLD